MKDLPICHDCKQPILYIPIDCDDGKTRCGVCAMQGGWDTRDGARQEDE